MYLEMIDNPDDVKKLSIDQLCELATEIREALLSKASAVGGHLSSNLGIVETTIALHYVFNSPSDKIIFDVSHQCYTHKMLTGRRNGFTDTEQYAAINGYTNPKESAHDLFRVGHSSTSISLACGIAKARDLRGERYNVISLIGDGALGGGEALEGLNYAGDEIKGNFIIVLNDNQMSIAENHGGIYKGLKELRDTNGSAPHNLFKALGYDYVFIKDGHDIKVLVDTLNNLKDSEHPVVVHIVTTKGKGYEYAEKNPEGTHWVRPFDLKSGLEKSPFYGERYDRIVRDHLIKKMYEDPSVVTMIAAVPDALSFTREYRQRAGEQFIDVGIMEEHAVSMAAGLAKNGCKPVFVTMSTFFQRTYDQISQELCINKMPVTLVVVNASVYAANDVTHIGIFDISMMSNIPNLVYIAPTNRQEYLAMLDWSIEQKEYPVAIRAPRNGIFEAGCEVDSDYSEINKYKTVLEGRKIAIIALGDFFQMGEELHARISNEWGFSPTLINPRFITGLDTELLEALKRDHDMVITLEDGILEGGWGQKISCFYGPDNMRVFNYGLKKEFLDRYNVQEIMNINHLNVELIMNDIASA